MDKMKMTDAGSAGPINLDTDQLKELDKLIDNLKKEIVFPGRMKDGESVVNYAESG